MKKIFTLSIVIINIILIALVIYLLIELNSEREQYSDKMVKINNADTNNLILTEKKKDIDTVPGYVPPKNGGNNKNWSGYKHRNLLKDRQCYFGRGLGKMHRWGQKMKGSTGD